MWTTTTCWSATSTSTTPTGEGGGGMCALLALGSACAAAYAVVQPGVCFSPLAAVLAQRCVLPCPQAALWHHCEPAPPRLP